MKMELELKVKNMHCGSCVQLIEEHLSEMKGILGSKAILADDKVKVSFDSEITDEKKIKSALERIGHPPEESNSGESDSTLKKGIIYGLVPHIGCIGFIAASILGVTVAVELFKPLLMNPWFFHILMGVAFLFATISSAVYLRSNGLLSWKGIVKKKKYLVAMYGSTLGINLILFLAVFPMLANLDTGSFSETTALVQPAAVVPLDSKISGKDLSTITLSVAIPCPGHAPLISGELKTIPGVTGVKFNFPDRFDVAYDSSVASKSAILDLDVFNTYPAKVEAESVSGSEPKLAELKESTLIQKSSGVEISENSELTCGVGSCGCGFG